jgi:hypothetical protein
MGADGLAYTPQKPLDRRPRSAARLALRLG